MTADFSNLPLPPSPPRPLPPLFLSLDQPKKAKCTLQTNCIRGALLAIPFPAPPCQQPPTRTYLQCSLFFTLKLFHSSTAFESLPNASDSQMVADSLDIQQALNKQILRVFVSVVS